MDYLPFLTDLKEFWHCYVFQQIKKKWFKAVYEGFIQRHVIHKVRGLIYTISSYSIFLLLVLFIVDFQNANCHFAVLYN